MEYIILITAKYLNEKKPQYLAKFYMNYVDIKLTWDEFASYSEIIERFLPGDIETLERGNHRQVHDEEVYDFLLRLTALGLMSSREEDILVPTTLGQINITPKSVKDYLLTGYGSKMRECLGFTDMGYLQNSIEDLADNGRINS